MSHTATCERDQHLHVDETSALGPPPLTQLEPERPPRHVIARRARTLAAFVALPEARWAALSLLAFGLAGALLAAGGPAPLAWLLFAVCYAAGGWQPALAGLRALRAKTLDVDLLMVVAALVAAGIGQVFDGGLLIVIFATSGALEAVATKRTRDSVRSLLSLAPARATRLDADGGEREVDAATLAAGDVVLVRPGERVGADGRVQDGASEIDQASITGEPLPVAKTAGDEVFAGTLNGAGALRVRVERAAAETARTQLFIEKVEQRYSVGVVAGTLALFVVPLAFGAALTPTLLRAMTFMIVASPCAVVLATMPPLLSAIANAGRHGVLVKSAVVMEQLGYTGVVAFDKTGTLTEGVPRVADVAVLPGAGLTEYALLGLAAAVERPSEHPLGRAVVAAARERGLPIPDVAGFASRPGPWGHRDGGRPDRERRWPRHVGENARGGPRMAAVIDQLQRAGRTAVLIRVDGEPAGVLGLADRLRPGVAETVGRLGEVTGSRPVLLTGDSAGAARRLAAEAGITDVRVELLPDGKVTAVHGLRAEGRHVTLVGDGVNDAPALAAADTGVAMGRHGSDLALETADAVIVRDEFPPFPPSSTCPAGRGGSSPRT